MNLAPTSVSKAPNDLVTATMRKLVGREEKREVVGNFEAIELQPHTAVGIVFNQARMFLALSEHDCCHTSERMAGCAPSLLMHALHQGEARTSGGDPSPDTMPGPPGTILPCAFVTTTLPLSSHRAGNATIRDAGVSLPTKVLVPPIPFAQDAVRETVPSVIEPVICFALGPSPCQVPSMKAKLVFTEVCDVIVRVWSGALLDDLR